MNYMTVYDAAGAGIPDMEVVAIGGGAALIGLVALATSGYQFQSWERTPRVIFGLGGLVIGLILTSIPLRNYWLMRHHEPAHVIEGRVSYFVPMQKPGHADEIFCVRETCFSYSDNEMAPGFKNTSLYGGPIRLGLDVRVTYVGNMILKLEIAR
jgi:hypothetical protein